MCEDPADDHSLLKMAVLNNSLCLARMLLDRDVDVNYYGPGDMSVLGHALVNCHLDMFYMLVDYNACLNSLDQLGNNALHVIVDRKYTADTSYMTPPPPLSAPCSPGMYVDPAHSLPAGGAPRDHGRHPALALGVRNTIADNYRVSTRGAPYASASYTVNPELTRQPMPLAAPLSTRRVFSDSDSSIMMSYITEHRVLGEDPTDLDDCTPPSLCNLVQCAPIENAIRKDNVIVLRALIDAGADISITTAQGETLMFLAARLGHADCVRLLIAAGADVHTPCLVPATLIAQTRLPLFKRNTDLSHPSPPRVRLPRLSSRSKLLATPLFAAIGPQFHQDVAEVLVRNGARVNAVARVDDQVFGGSLVFALRHGASIGAIIWLLRNGAAVNQSSADPAPLAVAAQEGRGDACLVLLHRGAGVFGRHDTLPMLAWELRDETAPVLHMDPVTAATTTVAGYTALEHVMDWGAEDMGRLMVEVGAENTNPSWGQAALIGAMSRGLIYTTTVVVDRFVSSQQYRSALLSQLQPPANSGLVFLPHILTRLSEGSNLHVIARFLYDHLVHAVARAAALDYVAFLVLLIYSCEYRDLPGINELLLAAPPNTLCVYCGPHWPGIYPRGPDSHVVCPYHDEAGLARKTPLAHGCRCSKHGCEDQQQCHRATIKAAKPYEAPPSDREDGCSCPSPVPAMPLLSQLHLPWHQFVLAFASTHGYVNILDTLADMAIPLDTNLGTDLIRRPESRYRLCLTGPGSQLAACGEWAVHSVSNTTAVTLAAINGHVDVVKRMVSEAENGYINGKALDRALIAALREGHEDVALVLLAHGANPDATDPELGHTVWAAVVGGKVAALRLILDQGGNPDLWLEAPPVGKLHPDGFEGRWALAAAAKRGDNAMVQMLLRAGASVRHPSASVVHNALAAYTTDYLNRSRCRCPHASPAQATHPATSVLKQLGPAVGPGSAVISIINHMDVLMSPPPPPAAAFVDPDSEWVAQMRGDDDTLQLEPLALPLPDSKSIILYAAARGHMHVVSACVRTVLERGGQLEVDELETLLLTGAMELFHLPQHCVDLQRKALRTVRQRLVADNGFLLTRCLSSEALALIIAADFKLNGICVPRAPQSELVLKPAADSTSKASESALMLPALLEAAAEAALVPSATVLAETCDDTQQITQLSEPMRQHLAGAMPAEQYEWAPITAHEHEDTKNMWLRRFRHPRHADAVDDDSVGAPATAAVLGGESLLFWSSLMLAVTESGAPYSARLLEVLLMAGVPVNFADDDGNTALHLALGSHKMDIVQVLLNRQADVNHANAQRITPLMLAAREGSDVMLQLLIEKKADINSTRDNGWTALVYAAQSGYGDNVKVLLDARADVSKADFRGLTALDYAKEGGFGDTVKALLGDAVERTVRADDDVEGPFEDDINYAIQAATEDNGIPDDFGSDEE